jgi:hypothetical protein
LGCAGRDRERDQHSGGVAPRLLGLNVCGEGRRNIDESMQSRIESELSQTLSWHTKTLLHSSTHNGRLLELVRDGVRVTISLHYLVTSEDAAKYLKCQLQTISVPRYKSVPDIGDEAYVLKTSHLLFRTDTVVLGVDSQDQSFETEREIARHLISAIKAK